MIPRIENPFLSNFAQRGQDLRKGFANRFGGGFVGVSDISQTFQNDAGDMINKVVETDTKTINNLINNSLSDRIQEEIRQDLPTYTRSNQSIAETQMSPEQAQQMFSSMIQDQETTKKEISPASPEEYGMRNAAAALKTTEDATVNAVQNTTFDPKKLQAILDAARNASGFTGLTSGLSPLMFQTRNDAFQLPDKPPVQIEPPAPKPEPQINQKFDDLIGDVIGKNTKTPEDYQLSKMNVTYTKVTPQPDEETLDSVIVSATKEKKQQPRVYEPEPQPEPEPRPTEPSRPQVQPQQNEAEGDEDPFSKFKRLYTEFYGGDVGQVKALLSGRERKFTADDYKPQSLYSLDYDDKKRKIVKDTSEIIKAQASKFEMRDFAQMVNDNNVQNMNQQPMIINNNNTIVTPATEEASTGRVFNDDNTFNRQSSADSQHPNYSGSR